MRVEFEVRASGETATPVIVRQGVNEVVTPIPTTEAATPATPATVPSSGFRRGLKEVGRGLGWVTAPIWWPISESAQSAKRMVVAPWHAIRKTKAWVDRAKNDVADYQRWTPQERLSVRRQQVAWVGALLAGSVAALCLPGGWALLPLLTVSGLWWLRSHNTRFPLRFDAVRWVMYLPQISRPQENP